MVNNRKIIGMCIAQISEETNYELVTEFNKYISDKDYNLFVYTTCTDLYRDNLSERGDRVVFDLIDFDIVDILIIYEEKIKDKKVVERIISEAFKKNIPVITIGNSIMGSISVKFDFEKGFESVVEHVIRCHNVRKPHFMAGMKNNEFSDARIAVYRKVIEANGIEFDLKNVSYGDFWSVPTEKAVEKLILENAEMPDAIICANDSMAVAVCNVLKRYGYSIPKDVIVSGFDGIMDIKLCNPNITSAYCSYKLLAEKLAFLTERIFNDNSYFIENKFACYLITPSLILSESCGCCKTEKVSPSDICISANDRLIRYQSEDRSFTHLSSRIHTANSIPEVSEYILEKRDIIFDVCCVIKKEYADETINPQQVERDDFSDAMYILFDTDSGDGFTGDTFYAKSVIPDIEKALSWKMPLIFVAIHFNAVPIGYMCYHFHNYDIVNYVKIIQTTNAMNSALGIFRNMRYQNYLRKHIEDIYKLDPLTSLYNRNGLMNEYSLMARSISENSNDITIVLSDLDGLKYINDTFGHNEGDNAIKISAMALKSACPQGAVCARFGGDELIAICSGKCDGISIKNKMNDYYENYNKSSGKPYKVISSVGVYATGSIECNDFESLLKKADELMYAEKIKKKNRRR